MIDSHQPTNNPCSLPMMNVRRHNSLPATRSSASSSLLWRNKCNPHVGSFRHAPPSNTAAANGNNKFHLPHFPNTTHAPRKESKLLDYYALPHKHSPYVGSFRHAPAYSNKSWMETVLCDLLFQQHQDPPYQSSLRSLTDLIRISGHLRGGSPYWRKHPQQHEEHVHVRLGQAAGGAVTSALVKLACWVMFGGEQQPTLPSDIKSRQLSSRSDDNSSHSLSSDESSSVSNDSSDDISCCSSTTSGRRRPQSSAMQDSLSNLALVSSQAEAYYAHTLVNRSTASSSSNYGSMDTTITQMDVLRMLRNASRHLDVESIAKLPVTTYMPPAEATKSEGEIDDDKLVEDDESLVSDAMSSFEDVTESPEMSWLLIDGSHPERSHVTTTTTGLAMASSSSSSSAAAAKTDDRMGDSSHVCVICLEHFVAGDRLRVLPCQHSFHVGCIDRWLSGSSSFDDCVTSGCPTCKKRPNFVSPATPTPLMGGGEVMDGSVPSWAFARIGNALAASVSE
jgi:hypothetical protein